MAYCIVLWNFKTTFTFLLELIRQIRSQQISNLSINDANNPDIAITCDNNRKLNYGQSSYALMASGNRQGGTRGDPITRVFLLLLVGEFIMEKTLFSTEYM